MFPEGQPMDRAWFGPGQLDLWGAVFESMTDALMVVDAQRHPLLVNPAAFELLGEDCFLKPLEDWTADYGFLGADGATPLAASELPLLRALRGAKVEGVEVRVTQPPKGAQEPIWFSATAQPLRDDAGKIAGAFCVFRDISLRKRIEGDLLLRDRAMAAAQDGITISDNRLPDQPLVYVNEGFERLSGYQREEVLGRNCRFLQQGETDAKTRTCIRDALETGQACVVELLNYRKDGSPFWNRLSISPIYGAGGAVTHFVGVQSDISDRVQAQRQLEAAMKDLRAANEDLVRNLRTAAQVQQTLLPPRDLGLPGLECAWHFQPCARLAGDLLGVFPLDDSHVGMYVLDVVGHGTAAALLSVAVCRSLIPSTAASSVVYVRRRDGSLAPAPPSHVLRELNTAFPWTVETGQFFTMVYGVLNTATREFRFCTAGHPGVLLAPTEGSVETHRTGGFPVGVGEGDFPEKELLLLPGDVLVLYSDGVTESMNLNNEVFGEERLIDGLKRRKDLPVSEQLDDLLSRLDAWRGGRPPRDDVSLLACRVR